MAVVAIESDRPIHVWGLVIPLCSLTRNSQIGEIR